MAQLLLIDDDEAVLRMMERTLLRLGHQVLSCTNGREGLARLDQGSVDLVITDMLMPEADGLEVIRAVKSQLPNVPILVVSGGGYLEPEFCLEMAEKLGADAVLPKPVPLDQLSRSIDALALLTSASAGQGQA